MLTANTQALPHFAVGGGQTIEYAAESINAHLDRHTEAARYLTGVRHLRPLVAEITRAGETFAKGTAPDDGTTLLVLKVS